MVHSESNQRGYNPAGGSQTAPSDPTRAVDKTNATSNSIPTVSLPKGGGAIRGMGEKFAANPVTGTGSMSVPIATSPGRAGFGPQLALSYDSGAGNGPFGFGWSLSLPSITRKTDKGLPQYRDANESDVFILSGAEDLVPVLVKVSEQWQPESVPRRTVDNKVYTVRRYRPRIEGLFARIEKWISQTEPQDSFWRSISKDNITTWYGRSENSRIADPADPTRIFSWLICESHDDKGNVIVYEYKPENDTNVDLGQANEPNRVRTANRYLKHIYYGNQTPYFPQSVLDNPPQAPEKWFFEVVFDYGEHDQKTPTPDEKGVWPRRIDPFSSYRAGFEVRTYRLCQRVLMFHHIPDLSKDEKGYEGLVRSTDFTYAYEQKSDEAHAPIFSFLLSVAQSGYKCQGNDYRKKSLPPVEFTYSTAEIQTKVKEVDATSLANLPIGLDGAIYQWVDLDSEGLSGILTEQADGWFYKRNLSANNLILEGEKERAVARFGAMELVARKPALGVAEGGQFLDLAGDGQLDLVQMNGPVRGFYERTTDDNWATFQPFTAWPNLDMRDPNLKFVDLTGDGHADMLISEGEVITWHPSLAEQGFGPAIRVSVPLDEEQGPRLIFADGTQSIYLADMSGDGLTDLVRIRNGALCYWPNLGYGRFGAKVTMDDAPWFDHPDQFNQQRIRLADIDGSGITDILYLGRDGVRVYFNQSGNAWSEPQTIPFPPVDNLTAVQVVDLLGNGTACLVWSSPLPGAARQPMRYIDLMGQKPHLLVKTVNNLGAETQVEYASSTQFYLQDKFAGKPWITRLPFPVHVVERVETYDHISRNRFVTRYAYHHGYFDGEEREFRGFGMVEQWDTEEIGKLLPEGIPPTATNLDKASFVPPVLTKSWFHTGVYLDRDHLSNFFAGMGQGDGEYYRPPALRGDDSHDPAAQALLLPDTVLPAGLTLAEEREACRALKGSMLRQEIFALDDTPKAEHPYTVTEQNFTVQRVQAHGDNRHAVLFTHPREAITYHYERNPADPRVSHALTLEVDEYGNVLQSISIGYGRCKDSTDDAFSEEDHKKQRLIHITYTENIFTKPSSVEDVVAMRVKSLAIDEADAYRVPLLAETRTYELRKPQQETSVDEQHRLFHFDDIVTKVTQAGDGNHDIPYEDIAFTQATEAAKTDEKEKNKYFRRLIEHVRTLYRPNDLGATDNNPVALLPLSHLESMALPGESYKLAFTHNLLKQINVDSGKLSVDELPIILSHEGGYVHNDGDTNWWIPSGRAFYHPESGAMATEELSEARKHFFLPRRFRDPFGSETIIHYDGPVLPDQPRYDLLVTRTVDTLENEVRAENDYRVLQPRLITDPNGNRSEAIFDALGMVVGTAVMGKVGEHKGDLIDATFLPDLDADTVIAHINEPFADPHNILQKATTRLVYDLFAYQRTKDDPQPQPAVVYTLVRETHHFDAPAVQPKVQHSFSYSDGFGRELQKKIQAEPGPLVEGGENISPRWVGSGWTIFNNKGKPIRQYEPFFTPTHHFEFANRVGVSPVLFYDPVERVVATLHPNHTYEKVVFDPWQQITWDVNDTLQVPAIPGDPPFDPKDDPDVGQYFARLATDEYLPTWYDCRTADAKALLAWPDTDANGQALPDNAKRRASEKSAAAKATVHTATPTVAHFDTLGRPFLTVAHNKFKREKPDGTFETIEEKYSTRVELDIEGNQRAVRDAIVQNADVQGRIVMRYAYDLLGNRSYQISMEAGARWMLNDVTGQPIRSWDSRGHCFRHEYDSLRRPVRHFVRGTDANQSDPRTLNQDILFEKTDYGEGQPGATTLNLRTRVFKQYDGAGVVTSEEYDFKGNLSHSSRELAPNYTQLINWATVQPSGESFSSSTLYDALNRPVLLTTPHTPTMPPNLIRPSYNEANLLERVDANLRGAIDDARQAVWTPFVADIDYDAKGQRMLIDYGNGVRTTYAYDPRTFRLVHLLTRRDASAFPNDCPRPPLDGWPGCQVQNLHYTYDPAGNITHIRDDAQQTIFFRNQRVEPSAEYTYDAIYRLIEATGREHLGQLGGAPMPHSYNDAGRVGLLSVDGAGRFAPNDGNAMGIYTECYLYDAVGNFLEMLHRGSDPIHPGWTRTYAYGETSLIEDGKRGALPKTSNRLSSTTVGSNPPEPYGYDAHGNMLHMPQLQIMQWDFKDQLQLSQRQKVNDEDAEGVVRHGERTYYVYDAAGQRVRKVTELATGNLKEERIYLGGFEIYRRHYGDKVGLVRETLHLMDDKQRIALVETRNEVDDDTAKQLIRYQFGNHLGSASLELDEQAQVICYEEYYPYGSTAYQATDKAIKASAKRYRYTGKERDEESGLYYHGARYYAPWVGRWCSTDPTGLSEGVNPYVYVHDAPIVAHDPNGCGDVRSHFYIGNIMALAAGFSAEQAQKIATYAWLPDEVKEFNAIGRLATPLQGDPFGQGFHALMGADSARAQNVARGYLERTSPTAPEYGVYLHIFFDTYQHSRKGQEDKLYPSEPSPLWGGHWYDFSAPDDPRRPVFAQAALAAFSIMRNQAVAQGMKPLYSEREFAKMISEFQQVAEGNVELVRRGLGLYWLRVPLSIEEQIHWLRRKSSEMIRVSDQKPPTIPYHPDEMVPWSEYQKKNPEIAREFSFEKAKQMANSMASDVIKDYDYRSFTEKWNDSMQLWYSGIEQSIYQLYGVRYY